mgnify:CR=1 FL=1
MTGQKCFLPAEWHPQSAIQITWPDEQTDWALIIEPVVACYQAIARHIAARQKLLVVCRDRTQTERLLTECRRENVLLVEAPLNDTWARDHGPITLLCAGAPVWLDFQFNGWGLKYPANFDNLITTVIYQSGLLDARVRYSNQLNFVLEGGSIESDGAGTLLTTARCLLSPNRNGGFGKSEIEDYLKRRLHLQRILWLHSGHLAGDDTDGHIDTLARFCARDVIAYVRCDDPDDVHYGELKKMEEELQTFTTTSGAPYRLVPLPMADAIFDQNGERLPASYANFLILNDAVLVPCYGSDKDEIALDTLRSLFQDREIIGVDCRILLRQHGSLHCMAMQYPAGVIA